MKQYCRYCNNLVTGNGIWCSERQTELSEAYTKTINHCKDFEFNEIDAYDERKIYKSRNTHPQQEIIAEQFTLEQTEV